MKPTKTYERAPVYSDLEVNETRVGIDWLTITANTADRKKMILLRFLKHEAALQLMGETRKNWKWRGFEGGAIGGIRGATRADSDNLILSGQEAQGLLPIFAHLATHFSPVG